MAFAASGSEYLHLNPDLGVVLASELGLEDDSVAYLLFITMLFKICWPLRVDEVDLVLAHFLTKENISVGTYKRHVFGLRDNSKLYSRTLTRGLNQWKRQ